MGEQNRIAYFATHPVMVAFRCENSLQPFGAPHPHEIRIPALDAALSGPPAPPGNGQPPAPERGAVVYRPGMTMDELERAAILAALQEEGGNRRRAAEVLGIGERTLYRKIKRYGFS